MLILGFNAVCPLTACINGDKQAASCSVGRDSLGAAHGTVSDDISGTWPNRLWVLGVKLEGEDWFEPALNIQGIHKRMVRFQKLTRNLFLTLHGHNVHRQQRQLSKSLMRYQQFASHACCGASF